METLFDWITGGPTGCLGFMYPISSRTLVNRKLRALDKTVGSMERDIDARIAEISACRLRIQELVNSGNHDGANRLAKQLQHKRVALQILGHQHDNITQLQTTLREVQARHHVDESVLLASAVMAAHARELNPARYNELLTRCQGASNVYHDTDVAVSTFLKQNQDLTLLTTGVSDPTHDSILAEFSVQKSPSTSVFDKLSEIHIPTTDA